MYGKMAYMYARTNTKIRYWRTRTKRKYMHNALWVFIYQRYLYPSMMALRGEWLDTVNFSKLRVKQTPLWISLPSIFHVSMSILRMCPGDVCARKCVRSHVLMCAHVRVGNVKSQFIMTILSFTTRSYVSICTTCTHTHNPPPPPHDKYRLSLKQYTVAYNFTKTYIYIYPYRLVYGTSTTPFRSTSGQI